LKKWIQDPEIPDVSEREYPNDKIKIMSSGIYTAKGSIPLVMVRSAHMTTRTPGSKTPVSTVKLII